ncbi:uncharacterized protein LOC127749941 [Frankliniella occidentalis]|uniref:Uncharacterized protein LOC127749941 n=1 Tax=Frankliniella occidentalis TaxID=133901 RepID=A0A9C6U259_FRAOC|nr:uncharacterized protein LOC127749941 [Frankliniella occidentalis]
MLKFPVWDSNIIDIDVVDENVVNDGAVNRCVSVNYFDPYQKKFEDHMRGGVWLTCDNCNEKFLHRGRRKKKCIHTPDVCNSLSRENNMDPGEMPDILKGLSYVEEQLIARIHPVVSLYKIKGQQMAYSGNVINFPQNVKAFAKVLPHKVSDLANIITVRTSNAMTPKEFHVRGSKVLEALKWLQKNNKYYQDIEISLENVSSLPVDGNVYDAITSMQSSSMDEEEAGIEFESDDVCEDNVTESCVPAACVPTQNDSIRNVLDWPEMDNVPINEFKCEGYIAQAFPSADLRGFKFKTETLRCS